MVDILSFTTTLSVALDAGIAVLPCRVRGDAAAAYAAEKDAEVAVGRSKAQAGQISLSSPTIRERAVPPKRLVLPSPNGSTISYEMAELSSALVGASLRNADAVGEWICATYPESATIAVVAAGEQWSDGTLRPAFEDIWGAGAVLSALAAHGWRRTHFSTEADAAERAWASAAPDLTSQLAKCASGRELIDAGYQSDVDIAGEWNSSRVVPVLRDDRFIPAV